jgi:hypothetical protein
MVIQRHEIDRALARERFEASIDLLASVPEAARDADGVNLVAKAASEIVINGSVVDPDSPEIPKALRLGAQAYGAFFAAAFATPDEPVTVVVGDGRFTYHSAPEESTLHVGRWLDGFFFARFAADATALGHLMSISSDLLRDSSTKSPEYDYLYMEAIEAWFDREKSVADKIAQALAATNPNTNQVYDEDWALYLASFQIQTLMSVLTHDPDLNNVLAKAVESHRTYWSAKSERRRNYKGYVSLPLTVLALEAKRRGLPVGVESPYLATELAPK